MTALKRLEQLPRLDEAWLTIGNFDGVHLGHRTILDTLLRQAEGKESVVLTFRESPVKLLRPEMFMGYVLPSGVKKHMMDRLGVQWYVDLDLYDVMPMNPDEFILFLLQKIKTLHLFVGYNFRYGNQNRGDVNTLREQAARWGFDLHIFEEVLWNGRDVNSTAIRRLVQDGRLDEAASMLGRPFFYRAGRLSGDGIGRKIGYPTINLARTDQVLPPDGVYYTHMRVGSRLLPAMSYIGHRPSVGGQDLRIETNILEEPGDLSQEEFDLVFIRRIREEKTVHNLEELKDLLYNDRLLCLSLHQEQGIEKNFEDLLCGGI